MPIRIRTGASKTGPQGGVVSRTTNTQNSVLGPTIYNPNDVTTTDEIGNWGKDNLFDSKRVVRAILSGMSGTHPDGSVIRTANNFHPTAITGAAPTLLSPTGSDSSVVPTVFSRSNPSRPSFDAAVFLGELRDFPGMARQIWRHAIPLARRLQRRNGLSTLEALDLGVRDGAKHFLNNADSNWLLYQFGWRPFMNDIKKFLDVNQACERRFQTLMKLAEHGVKGAKVSIDKDTQVGGSSLVPIASLTSTVFYGRMTTVKKYERWGTTRWYLSKAGKLSLLAQDQARVRDLARQVVSGVNIDLSTAWNLFPWTWLLDWAGSTGDYISSQRNLIGASHGMACIMTHSESESVCVRSKGDDAYTGISGGNFKIINSRKLRTVHPSFTLPELTFPILDGRQTSILGALATTRLIR